MRGPIALALLAMAAPAAAEVDNTTNGIGTRQRWGGGIRLTGLSGIGALPGVNFGGEVAGQLRRDEYFVELALGRWKPEDRHMVEDGQTAPIPLAMNVWTARAGWSSMRMPLRGWVLAEVGDVSGASQMPGVVSRMVMGDTPAARRWTAVGAGLGVAWPMSDQARLVGNLEFAVPLQRDTLMLDTGAFQPDPISARYSIGLEVGWR